uniref:HIT-type domain-containing protein n=1 Tax=Trichuris muris TaxID=70415 RepID=A0A5S6QSM2_TRIMR
MEHKKLRKRGPANDKQEERSAPNIGARNESRRREILENLEVDNYQSDPHADFTWHKSIPRFEYGKKHKLSTGEKKLKRRLEQLKLRFRKPFDLLIQESLPSWKPDFNYLTVQAPSSRIPARKICFICGNIARYTCPKCGIQHCSLQCDEIHKETRCLKRTA